MSKNSRKSYEKWYIFEQFWSWVNGCNPTGWRNQISNHQLTRKEGSKSLYFLVFQKFVLGIKLSLNHPIFLKIYSIFSEIYQTERFLEINRQKHYELAPPPLSHYSSFLKVQKKRQSQRLFHMSVSTEHTISWW